MKKIAIVVVCLCAFISGADAATLLVGPGGTPSSLAQALDAARDGDVIELLAGEYKQGYATLPAKRITLRGVGQRPVFAADSKNLDHKAIWIVQGGDITVENVEFRGARSADADGAGIRLEGGHLHVVGCAFYDNEHGIQTSNDAGAELLIDNSIFAQAPKVVGGLAHLLNVGRIARLSVSGSRFQQGFEGHLIKSRARENHLTYNLIDDGPGGQASYEIDLPDGGQDWVIGNVIAQSGTAQNPTLVAFGAEGRGWDKNTLYLAHNTLINRHWMPAWFLRVFRDRLPKGSEVWAVNNLVVGPGLFNWGASAHFEGNAHTTAGTLVDLDLMDLELQPGDSRRGSGVDPRNIDGQDLSPKAEFTMPVGTRPTGQLTRWSPGAYQR